jgi:chromosome segregation ATPase
MSLAGKTLGKACQRPKTSPAPIAAMGRPISRRCRPALPTNQRRSSIRVARASGPGRSEEAPMAALKAELEVARQEAAAAAQLRAEVDARTAAMMNLQSQLDKVEALRAHELAAAGERFKHLEAALTEAEAEVETARQEASEAIARAEALRVAASEEAKAAGELLMRAEQLVAARESLVRTSSSMEKSPANESGLTEQDVESLLDELEAAQEDAAALRKQLAALSTAEDGGAKAAGELGEALAKQLAEARAAQAAARAEAEGLKARVSMLERQGVPAEKVELAEREAALAEGKALLQSLLLLEPSPASPSSSSPN